MIATQSPDLYIGLMSGTSLDAIDCAIVEFTEVKFEIRHTSCAPFPEKLRNRLLSLTQPIPIQIDELCQIESELTSLYGDVVLNSLDAANLISEQITAIGCHGQTIRHSPNTQPAYTFQIGDPGKLSADTSISVVGDFRRIDVALGGQGAPLAPAFHNFAFKSDTVDRAILNLGGIANITHLPSDKAIPITGYDTGPANTLLDNWIRKQHSENYDLNGQWASRGIVLQQRLFKILEQEPFFKQTPPKSTGTDYFSMDWASLYFDSGDRPVDVQATLSELTATTISNELKRIKSTNLECYICGGGAHNADLINRIKRLSPEISFNTTDKLGADPDFVEAIAFAWLARQALERSSGNLLSVTKASRNAILGGVYRA
jgi:anhydro-N-acetylmuramic acid kinase